MNRDLLKTLFDTLIANEDSVKVQLDPRVEDVVVPDRWKVSEAIVLEYGLGIPVPTTDLDVSERGLESTLSFNRTPFRTFVPWEAVSAVQGGQWVTLIFEWSGNLHGNGEPPPSPATTTSPFQVIDGGKKEST